MRPIVMRDRSIAREPIECVIIVGVVFVVAHVDVDHRCGVGWNDGGCCWLEVRRAQRDEHFARFSPVEWMVEAQFTRPNRLSPDDELTGKMNTLDLTGTNNMLWTVGRCEKNTNTNADVLNRYVGDWFGWAIHWTNGRPVWWCMNTYAHIYQVYIPLKVRIADIFYLESRNKVL